ncbi:MAG: hypothetical protein K1X72_21190 [Pyrinomonadaceae bacterium]|nr:hypothetical protein [Pyrinomonadaceae bacterium]
MNRRKFIKMSALAAPLALSLRQPVVSQILSGTAKSEQFTLDMLSSQDRLIAQQIGEMTAALFFKGLLNRSNPKDYPLPTDSSSPEATAAKIAANISSKVFERITPKLKTVLQEPTKLKLALGSLQTQQIDFRRPSLMPYFDRMSVKPSTRTPSRVLPSLTLPSIQPKFTSTPPLVIVPPLPKVTPIPSTPRYNRLDLVMRRLECLDVTDSGGTDSMILGGVKVEANGGVGTINAFICGDFDNGDVHDFGELPIAQYDLTNTAGYPKTVYAVFQLTESDQNDADAAKELNSALSTIINYVASLFIPGVGAVVGAIFSAINVLIDFLIDDDYFPPYGIRLTMNNENPFGSAVSPEQMSGFMDGHDGRYRIHYKWILNA